MLHIIDQHHSVGEGLSGQTTNAGPGLLQVEPQGHQPGMRENGLRHPVHHHRPLLDRFHGYSRRTLNLRPRRRNLCKESSSSTTDGHTGTRAPSSRAPDPEHPPTGCSTPTTPGNGALRTQARRRRRTKAPITGNQAQLAGMKTPPTVQPLPPEQPEPPEPPQALQPPSAP